MWQFVIQPILTYTQSYKKRGKITFKTLTNSHCIGPYVSCKINMSAINPVSSPHLPPSHPLLQANAPQSTHVFTLIYSVNPDIISLLTLIYSVNPDISVLTLIYSVNPDIISVFTLVYSVNPDIISVFTLIYTVNPDIISVLTLIYSVNPDIVSFNHPITVKQIYTHTHTCVAQEHKISITTWVQRYNFFRIQ